MAKKENGKKNEKENGEVKNKNGDKKFNGKLRKILKSGIGAFYTRHSSEEVLIIFVFLYFSAVFSPSFVISRHFIPSGRDSFPF